MNEISKNNLYHYVDMASKAPSGHNTQPWLFNITEKSLIVIPDYSRKLPVVDPDNHALFISLGCAVENICLAAAKDGFEPIIKFSENEENFNIKISFKEGTASLNESLYDYIALRQVTRSLYDKKSIEHSILAEANSYIASSSVNIHNFLSEIEMSRITSYILEANRLQFNDKAFKNELASWIRFNQKDAMIKGDGIWSSTLGMPAIANWIGNLIIKKIASVKGEEKKLKKMIQSSSGLILFSVKENDRKNWIELGRVFQRYTLHLTQNGIKHAHLNMPCEVEKVRNKMADRLDISPNIPLLLIRIGYSEPMPYSYRRKRNSIIQN